MAIEGTLDELSLPDILQMVGHQQKTGILTIQGDTTIVAVSFLDGRVVAADSLDETVEERLGEVLVSQGLLSRRDFARVVEEQRQGKGRLVDLLVDGGYLDRSEVLESLHVQTTRLLGQILHWERGEFKFYANDEVAFEEGFRPIAVDELLISLLPEEAGEEAPEEPPLADVVPLSEARRGGGQGASPEPDWREVTWTGEEVGADLGGEAADAESKPRGLMPYVPPETRGSEEAGRPPEPAPPPVPEPPLELAPEDGGEAEAATGSARAVPLGAVSAALALLLALTVTALLLVDPGSFLFPMPWQQDELDAYRGVQRQALYQTIDGAAKTFYLTENHFPDSLDDLVAASLLHPRDLVGPAGRRLELVASEESYEVRPAEGAGGADLSMFEAVTGDFLLDPGFLTAPQVDRTPPLVLLD